MKTGLTLTAVGVICLAVSSGGGPCPDGFWMVGLLSGIVGWVVSFTSLGTAVVRSARDVGVAALVAIVLTATIILLGNGHGWKVSEPDSWIHFAVFFVVPLTLAGVAALRRRKAAR